MLPFRALIVCIPHTRAVCFYHRVLICVSGHGRWTSVHTSGEPPSPRARHTCAQVGDRLVVFGGCDASGVLNDVYFMVRTFSLLLEMFSSLHFAYCRVSQISNSFFLSIHTRRICKSCGGISFTRAVLVCRRRDKTMLTAVIAISCCMCMAV